MLPRGAAVVATARSTVGVQRSVATVDHRGMSIAEHWVAHTREGWKKVCEPESAAWLWDELRRWAPDALAGCLMDDHLHLARPPGARRADLATVLRRHGRCFGTSWDVAEPQPATTRAIAARTIQYVHLNPVRDGLASQPLGWEWSTARDLVDAVADPWVPLARLTSLLRRSPDSVLDQVLAGAWDDRPAGDPVVADLRALEAATCAALRRPPSSLQSRTPPARSVFVDLAFQHGAPRTDVLGEHLAITARAVRMLRGRAPAAALQAAALCLRDPRLRRSPTRGNTTVLPSGEERPPILARPRCVLPSAEVPPCCRGGRR